MSVSLTLRWLVILTMLSLCLAAAFLLLGDRTEALVTDLLSGSHSASGLWALIVAALALDVVLPVPSSVVNVSAGTMLGVVAGTLACWSGMTLSCLLGYWIGATGGSRALGGLLGKEYLQRSAQVSQRIALGSVLVMRAVPVLAETSTIAAGVAGLPLRKFFGVVALANLGIAAAYASLGALALEVNSFLLALCAALALPVASLAGRAAYGRLHAPGSAMVGKGALSRSEPAPEAAPVPQAIAGGGEPATLTVTQAFSVDYEYRVVFTRGLFDPGNPALRDALAAGAGTRRQRCLVFVDRDLLAHLPTLSDAIGSYFRERVEGVDLVAPPIAVAGGEAVKAGFETVFELYRLILEHSIDRHSYVLAVGGGAVLDAVGMAAATAHRGIRHIRVPTTVLSQNDSGVGVKNAVNFEGSKNFAGSFAPPWAVLNDFDLLETLPAATRRSGISEAVKVSLIRDPDFFSWLEANATRLKHFEPEAEEYMIRRSAELHMRQIALGGDPFERGSARPLDFGHWSAHKLEGLTHYEVSHGDAVAMGIALDARYSVLAGLLAPGLEERVLAVLRALGLPIWHDALAGRDADGRLEILVGLEEFREHLGGELTVTLLAGLGVGVEVNEMRPDLVAEALAWLAARAGADGRGRG
ncbi:3-dehydroquinate synthase [Salipiger mangrovisoli]|uniref:3-dehydroquinate synthase n=1 Tax=Salipiger mangrovisoli TaxID=2865933 RepID=A0ABR9X8B5_9RHOB|nr:3-dehydroquinate synthase [Salipiger mangrovisoli]MBE9639671.1 3-dehydroquinate synthase [Salipiger mangrovisoli]